ncbi:MAG: DUF362 domain-containing protein [Promethearchaeota archaeon]
MKSKVYFFTARTLSKEESMSMVKGPLSLEKLGFEEKVRQKDKVVIKTHFGALENVRHLRPSYIRFLCDYIKSVGAIPSVAESCGWGAPEEITGIHTEYSGRATEKEYLEVALKHGYTKETMGAEILMLDGPDGTDFEIQKIEGKRFQEVLVAGRLREFDHLILASHFKGHVGAGFGGAIKNLGIGCVAKGGKVQAHLGKKFEYVLKNCAPECDKCIKACPRGALRKDNDNNLIKNWELCGYCYVCRSVCKNGVIVTDTITNEEFLLQMVDNARGVVDYFGRDRIFYINYAIDITWQCDCTGGSDTPFIPDIGILSSLDPVALDQACIDLAHSSYMNPYSILGGIDKLSLEEKKPWFSFTPRFDPNTGEYDLNKEGKVFRNWEFQLQAAEEMGLGSRNYSLIEVQINKQK